MASIPTHLNLPNTNPNPNPNPNPNTKSPSSITTNGNPKSKKAPPIAHLPPPPSRRSLPPPPPSTFQHQQENHPYQQRRRSSASFKSCCCCLFLLLTFLALLALASALVVVLVLKPRKPHFDLQQVSVSYLLIAQPDSPPTPLPQQQQPAAFLTMNISLLFSATNPNKVGIRYVSPGGLTVMYRGVPLALATVPEFDQPAHSTRLVQTRVAVSRVDILRSDALELVRDATLNDRVELRIVGDVGARIHVVGLTTPKVQVSVDCAVVISPKRQSVTYKGCGVDGLSV